MDFMELITKRASVRHYDRRPVPREDIISCLEAARLAPSACNSQPWQFIVIDTPQMREKLCSASLSGIYGMNTFMKDAPVLVAVVTDAGSLFPKICNTVRDTKMYLIDLGMACEHFALRAAELGIGSCFLGWFNEKAVKKALGIRLRKRVDIIISMGYPSSEYTLREKTRKDIGEMSSFE